MIIKMPDASKFTKQKLSLALVAGKNSRLTTDNDTAISLTEARALVAGLINVNSNKRATQASTLALLKRVTGPRGYVGGGGGGGGCPDGIYAGVFDGTLAGGILTYEGVHSLPAISISVGTYEITGVTALINCSADILSVNVGGFQLPGVMLPDSWLRVETKQPVATVVVTISTENYTYATCSGDDCVIPVFTSAVLNADGRFTIDDTIYQVSNVFQVYGGTYFADGDTILYNNTDDTYSGIVTTSFGDSTYTLNNLQFYKVLDGKDITFAKNV